MRTPLSAFVLAGVLFSFASCAPAADAPAEARKDVKVEEFDALRADKEHVVLDVRTPREFQQGHIPGAVNIDIGSADFEKKLGGLEKGKVYLVYCAVGGRSARACDKMATMGFKDLRNLLGGIREWEKAGKAIEK